MSGKVESTTLPGPSPGGRDAWRGAATPCLRVRGLAVRFRTAYGDVAALSGIDLDVAPGEFRVVIGESGSGKSVLAHALLGLLPRNVDVRGSALLDGRELIGAPADALRQRRRRDIAFIPQSPATALNPVRRIGSVLEECARAKGVARAEVGERLRGAAAALGLDLDAIAGAYPHQLSGGMQQRVVTSLALIGRPSLVVADEPTSGLDADLVADTAAQLVRVAAAGSAVVVITHDLELARSLGGRLALLYAGHLVEDRPTGAFFDDPAHPYGRALLDALPERGANPIDGLPPPLTALPEGCPFAPRCAHAETACRERLPDASPLPDGSARCVLHAAG